MTRTEILVRGMIGEGERSSWWIAVASCLLVRHRLDPGASGDGTGRGLDQPAATARPRVFRIHVVEEGTGRGVPLVELRTVNQIRYITDSNGIVAFDEPGLFNRKVYFTDHEPRLRS